MAAAERTEDVPIPAYQRLRRLRRERGLSADYVARKAGMSAAKLSRIETGVTRLSVVDFEMLISVLSPNSADRLALTMSARERETAAEQRLRLHFISSDTHAQDVVLALEQKARLFRFLDLVCISGLLQTTAYMQAVFAAVQVHDDATIQRAVRSRLERQSVLYDLDRRFEFVISEAALRTQFVSAEQMRAQYHHLLMCSSLPNVELRILPIRQSPAIFADASFLVLDDMVTISNLKRHVVVESHNEFDVRHDLDVFEGAYRVALGGSDTRDFLYGLIAEPDPVAEQSQFVDLPA